MKASELIKHLQELIQEQGDMDCYLWDHRHNDGCAVEVVTYEKEIHPESLLAPPEPGFVIWS